MFSVIRWIVGAFSSTASPDDAWRFVATTIMVRRTGLRDLAFAVSSYAQRLTAGNGNPLRDGLNVLRSPPIAPKLHRFESSKIPQKAPPPSIYLDLTDVVSYAIWHDSCAGIPRVQLEVATNFVRSNPAVYVVGSHNQKWYELRPLIEAADGNVDAIFCLLKETFSEFEWTLEGLRAFFNKRRRKFRSKRRTRTPELKTNDTLFIGGAFWVNRETISFCRQAAASHANLIILLHDLIPITNPEFTGHDFREEYVEMLSFPAHFIVTTAHSRSELEQVRREANAGSLRTCSSIVPLADEFPGSVRNARPHTASDRLASLIGQDFVLCVGTIEVRKNHLMLLSVWNELAVELGDRLPQLVIAGRRGWKADAALAKLDETHSFPNRIIFIEAPTDNELRWLYSSCVFTVFPSFFEGWGLPIGESFWFGKPCAASKTSSIPAVGRDLCAYFSPYDPWDMKDAIRTLFDIDAHRSFQTKIESAPLRTWSEVARDIEAVIIQRPPMSDSFRKSSHPVKDDGTCKKPKD